VNCHTSTLHIARLDGVFGVGVGDVLAVPRDGERLRLIYLLYRGDAPAAPSTATAYREVHLWVNVTASS
jgi:uncharacterized membrane protein